MGGFKVGDRVFIPQTEANNSNVLAGDQGVIEDRFDSSYRVLMDEPRKGERSWYFFAQDMQHVPAAGVAADDAVMRPAHYARYAIEPITFITANSIAFLPGNVIKYVLRYDAKNGLEDLRKAKRYLEIMIEDVERRAAGNPIKVEAV